MPKSNLDWLGIISLWLGALIMAIKAGDLPVVGGFPTWLSASFWSFVPSILVTIYLSLALFRFLMPLKRGADLSKSSLVGVDDAHRRRKLIEDGRSFIVAFNRQEKIANFMDFLEQQDGWYSMRRHLDQDILKDMENRRLFVATAGAGKDGKTGYLAREMDRLEQDWGLD